MHIAVTGLKDLPEQVRTPRGERLKKTRISYPCVQFFLFWFFFFVFLLSTTNGILFVSDPAKVLKCK